MKTVLTVLVLAVAVGGCNKTAFPDTARGGEMSRAVLDPYLKIQDALTQDSTDGRKSVV